MSMPKLDLRFPSAESLKMPSARIEGVIVTSGPPVIASDGGLGFRV